MDIGIPELVRRRYISPLRRLVSGNLHRRPAMGGKILRAFATATQYRSVSMKTGRTQHPCIYINIMSEFKRVTSGPNITHGEVDNEGVSRWVNDYVLLFASRRAKRLHKESLLRRYLVLCERHGRTECGWSVHIKGIAICIRTGARMGYA